MPLPAAASGFQEHALLEQRLDVGGLLCQQLVKDRVGLVELALAAQRADQLDPGPQQLAAAALLLQELGSAVNSVKTRLRTFSASA